MTIDDKIRDGKVQHDINREAAKISALSSSRIDKYEFLTGEVVDEVDEVVLQLPSDQRGVRKQVYMFLFRKSFRKTKKTIEGQGEKKIKALKIRVEKKKN